MRILTKLFKGKEPKQETKVEVSESIDILDSIEELEKEEDAEDQGVALDPESIQSEIESVIDNTQDILAINAEHQLKIDSLNANILKLNDLISEKETLIAGIEAKLTEAQNTNAQLMEQIKNVAVENETKINLAVSKQIAALGFSPEQLPEMISDKPQDIAAKVKKLKGKELQEFVAKNKEELWKLYAEQNKK